LLPRAKLTTKLALPLSVKKFAGLVVGSLASGIGLLALSAPAQAIVSCTGNNVFGSTATGSGKNCGVLPVGATFELDVTEFFAGLGTLPFNDTQFGIGIVTSGTSQVAFSNVSAVVTGIAGFPPNDIFSSDPIAIWAETLEPVTPVLPALGQPNPAGTALAASGFIYSAPTNMTNGPIAPLDTFREISFAFTQTGEGQFGSFKASPNDIFLTKVDRFLITGTLTSVGTGDPLATNIISFGVGPAGRPDPGTTFGGFFTAAVPGPLPIAGAGAAFAWSRKLRRKQKLGAGC
jgi:hypothetical protein